MRCLGQLLTALLMLSFAAPILLAAEDLKSLETRFNVAHEDRLQGRSIQALEKLRELLTTIGEHPEFADLQLNVKSEMSEVYLSQNDLARAAACLEEIAARKPADGLVHYKLGLVYRDVGDYGRATLNLHSAIENGFNNLSAKVNLIESAFASKQTTLAVETAEQVITPALKSVELSLRLGRLLFNHLFYGLACKAFQLAHQEAPDAFEPRFRLALAYYLLEDYASALAMLQPFNASQLTPETASLAASAEAKLGHFDAATMMLQRSLALSHESPHAYLNLALIDLDRGNIAGAETLLEQFRALQLKGSAKVFYRVGRNSCLDMRRDQANRAVPAAPVPDKAEFYYQLAVQLQEQFNYSSAVELIRLAQTYEGNSARVLYIAGAGCLNEDPLSAQAVLFLQEAIKLDPSLHRAYYLLGRAFTHQGKPEEAVAAYQRAVALHSDPAYFVSLGRALGNSGTAIAAYEQALKVDPSYAEAHLELGRSFIRLECFERARQELEKAVVLEPDFYEADYLIARLEHRIGDEEQSRKYLALFNDKKSVLLRQSVIGGGYVGNGR